MTTQLQESHPSGSPESMAAIPTREEMHELRNRTVTLYNLARGDAYFEGWESGRGTGDGAYFREETPLPGISPRELTVAIGQDGQITLVQTERTPQAGAYHAIETVYTIGQAADQSHVRISEKVASLDFTMDPLKGLPTVVTSSSHTEAEGQPFERTAFENLQQQLQAIEDSQRPTSERPLESRRRRVMRYISHLFQDRAA